MNTHCHYCSATIGDAALKAGQVFFCSAECFHLGDGDAIECKHIVESRKPLEDAQDAAFVSPEALKLRQLIDEGLSGLPHTSATCAGCDVVLGNEAVYVEQTTGKAFCRACYVISDSPSSFPATRRLPDANSPFGHARQQIGELLIENAELKRQVDQLIKNGLSPEAKEIIERVAENLPTTIERAFKDRALRTAVEHYRQIGALQHSYKCTLKQCVCGVDNICNNL